MLAKYEIIIFIVLLGNWCCSQLLLGLRSERLFYFKVLNINYQSLSKAMGLICCVFFALPSCSTIEL